MSGELFHVGDTAKALTFVCGDWDPVRRRVVPANLTGAELEVHCKLPNQEVLVGEGEILDAMSGEGRYVWQPGDLSIHGGWEYEVQVTWADTTTQTFGPDTFRVARQIA